MMDGSEPLDLLVEVLSRVTAEIVYAQQSGDDRTQREIGNEVLIAYRMPDLREIQRKLRESEFERALERSEQGLPPLPPAQILEFRPAPLRPKAR